MPSGNLPDLPDIANASDIPSPALIVFHERLVANLDRMVEIAGDVDRLRPHVKTSKMPEVVELLRRRGVDKVKCATIAEAEMCAGLGVPDVLLSYPVVGPNVVRLLQLARTFPETTFRTIADDAGAVDALSVQAAAWLPGRTIDVLVDLDTGMHRTGVVPGDAAAALARRIAGSPGLTFGGLHAYDGQFRESDPVLRAAGAEAAHASVVALRTRLESEGIRVSRVVSSGTPTFAIHARRGDVECGPGTTTLWDASSAVAFPDLGFVCAAAVLGRVVSKPGPGRLCLDLGHKAVASEMPHPRMVIPSLGPFEMVGHSEEHLVVATDRADAFPVGAVLPAIPWHICPTVALHAEAVIVEDGRATRFAPVVARARRLTT
ncbi:MAG: D-TA family PLP-dependent enzyme [Armatimonadota bacterium]